MIYLDHNATTPLAPEVREVMIACLTTLFGNPSSPHWVGQQARARVDQARGEVASAIGAAADELIFTSGGTEANNLALLGVMRGRLAAGRRHLLVSAIEHHSVLGPAERLQAEGFEVEHLPVGADGCVSVDRAAALLRDDTALVS
ncbi:MAG: aminotransferase class V-fold PLP-dependent enzyme, partial [Deltaproteobacteria bacterium]|nr:aminotransferase class V-fold PLP-dependent enzyme [Deltaproteobacteria bacterium]